MLDATMFFATLFLLPLLMWLWAEKLHSEVNVLRSFDADKTSSNSELDERQVNARLEIVRDGVLACITFLGGMYLLLTRGQIVITSLSKLGLIEGFRGGSMAYNTNSLLRVLLGICAFLITFGLSASFLPGLFPYKKDSFASKSLSLLVALLLSSVFGLWLATSVTATTILDQITQEFTRILTIFLTILFTAIGVYLFWKQVKVWLKP